MSENLTPPSVGDMLRMTGANTQAFMTRVAEHLDKLEAEVVRLQDHVAELEGKQNDAK